MIGTTWCCARGRWRLKNGMSLDGERLAPKGASPNRHDGTPASVAREAVTPLEPVRENDHLSARWQSAWWDLYRRIEAYAGMLHSPGNTAFTINCERVALTLVNILRAEGMRIAGYSTDPAAPATNEEQACRSGEAPERNVSAEHLPRFDLDIPMPPVLPARKEAPHA